MKKLAIPLVVLSLATFVGCNKSAPGGPGASNTAHSTVTSSTHSANGTSTTHTESSSRPSVPAAIGGPKDTFKISAPSLTTHLKQGEQKTVDITLDRGSEFKQDVNLMFTSTDKGVTVTPSKHTIKAGDDKKFMVTVGAAKDAPIGDATITVTGKPETGEETSVHFKVSVAKGT